jgi:hypothetical protein
MCDLDDIMRRRDMRTVSSSEIKCLIEEVRSLRIVISAYATIEAARRIGRLPPEWCLRIVTQYYERDRNEETDDERSQQSE